MTTEFHHFVLFDHYLYEMSVSFQIYDFDGDGMINTRDLTIVVRATMREQDVVMHKGTSSLANIFQTFAFLRGLTVLPQTHFLW